MVQGKCVCVFKYMYLCFFWVGVHPFVYAYFWAKNQENKLHQTQQKPGVILKLAILLLLLTALIKSRIVLPGLVSHSLA